MDPEDPTLQRLDDQIRWYDQKSRENQLRFKAFKVLQLVTAAAIPVLAPFHVSAGVLAALGATIIVLEGVQQLNQYQQNWASYRSTCESLKHEKYLFLAGAGPYGLTSMRLPLLADRIEGLISQEHAKWVSARDESARRLQGERPAG